MIKLAVVVQIEQFHQSIDLGLRNLHLVFLAIIILSSEFVCELTELVYGDETIGKDFFLNVVDVVDEALERDELREGDFTFELQLIYTLNVFLDMIDGEAHEEALGEVLCADGLFLLVDKAVLVELVVSEGGLELFAEVNEVLQ